MDDTVDQTGSAEGRYDTGTESREAPLPLISAKNSAPLCVNSHDLGHKPVIPCVFREAPNRAAGTDTAE
ncbi:hypothetical protein D3C73_1386230 [compost metagenome]